MARKKGPKARKQRLKRKPPGAVVGKGAGLPGDVWNSPARYALSLLDLSILMGYYQRWNNRKKNGRAPNKPDNLVYTIQCMMFEHRCTKQAALNSRDRLCALGFIDVRYWSTVKGKPNVYELSKRHLKWSDDPVQRERNGFVAFEDKRPPKINPARSGLRPGETVRFEVLSMAN